MIERTCLKMHCTWNPTGAVDVGIDGFIEMFDRRTGNALGKHLAVQSKAVSALANDTGETFDFSCDPRDIAYSTIPSTSRRVRCVSTRCAIGSARRHTAMFS